MFAPRNQPIIDALDRTAIWVSWPFKRFFGFDLFATDAASRRHRSFRTLPMLLLGAATIGFGVMVKGHTMPGYLAITVAWCLSITLRQLSTVMEGQPHPDERQRALFRNSHFWGLRATVALAAAGYFYAAIAQPAVRSGDAGMGQLLFGHDLWFPAQPLEWMAIVFYLFTVETNVAMLVAGWTAPRELPDED